MPRWLSRLLDRIADRFVQLPAPLRAQARLARHVPATTRVCTSCGQPGGTVLHQITGNVREWRHPGSCT